MHARDTVRSDAPVELVDLTALPPDTWARYFVGMSEPEEITGDGGPGTTVKFTMSPPGSRPFKATCRIVAYDRHPDGLVHWRGEFSGGYTGWEAWGLAPCEGGTMVTDEMEVVPAGGPVVRLAANLFVQRQLRRNHHQSLVNLKQLVEGA
jgi:coenzyme Q-binding protein COQ10